MTEPIKPFDVTIDPTKPLLIVDVDEVLGLFMQGFGQFVAGRGFELRIDRYALYQNLHRPGETEMLDLEIGKALHEDYFRLDVHNMLPAPHAVESLRKLSRHASIVVLSNAPTFAREARSRWLVGLEIDFPLIINEGPKGAVVAALAERTRGPAAFVDDLLPHLDSVAETAPRVRRFQMVADERLRPHAPCAPDRHTRIDEWPQLAEALHALFRDRP